MSILVGLFFELNYHFFESLKVFLHTKDIARSQAYFAMSYRSIDTLSSCEELCETDLCGFRVTPSDAQSEVISSLPLEQVRAGAIVCVSGICKDYCEQFAVNLISSNGKSSEIALHFNPRPLQNYIVRNSKISGKKVSVIIFKLLKFY